MCVCAESHTHAGPTGDRVEAHRRTCARGKLAHPFLSLESSPKRRPVGGGPPLLRSSSSSRRSAHVGASFPQTCGLCSLPGHADVKGRVTAGTSLPLVSRDYNAGTFPARSGRWARWKGAWGAVARPRLAKQLPGCRAGGAALGLQPAGPTTSCWLADGGGATSSHLQSEIICLREF